MALPAQISSSHVGPSECPLSISLALTGGQQPETSGKEKGLVNFSFIDFMPPRPPHPEFPDPNFDVAAAVKANEPLYRIYQMMSLLSEQYGVVFCPPLLLTSNACRFRVRILFLNNNEFRYWFPLS